MLLSENKARQQLNWRVDQLASATGQHGRAVNTLINESIGVKTRKGISLSQLGAALTYVEQWLEDPSSRPTGRPAVSSSDLNKLHGAELRSLLTTYVGPLAKALRADIPLVQQRLNDWMNAPSRAEATDEQLRDAIIQAAAWLADPETYYACVTPQAIEPGGLPTPVHTKPAPVDSSCSLCAAPVRAGELIGRMPRPRQPFVAMASWLCAHCLFDRRAKPRLADVGLRVFHHAFSGSVPLNTAEAQVLSEALARVPAESTNVQEACDALDKGIDGNAPVMLLSEHLALASVTALQAAEAATDAHDVTILTAAVEHLSQWGHNLQYLNKMGMTAMTGTAGPAIMAADSATADPSARGGRVGGLGEQGERGDRRPHPPPDRPSALRRLQPPWEKATSPNAVRQASRSSPHGAETGIDVDDRHGQLRLLPTIPEIRSAAAKLQHAAAVP
ncbi:hypothetical protein ACF05L_33570 [Streptomyces bobili]|uniref:hypothetical protein n=1 Tax=Streptomyces bobili TaxID=67280 RepID=UPI0036F85FB2